MVWLAFIVLVAVALYLLLRPLSRGPAAIGEARASELAVYRDQLAEVDADLARGLISPAEAEAARTEIRRKMLAVAPRPLAAGHPEDSAGALRIAVAVGVPIAAIALYLTVGQPDLPGSAFSPVAPGIGEPVASTKQLPAVETMVTRLAERLKKAPDDAKGWRMLGWSYAHLDRFADAAKAYERAVALNGKDAALRAQHGEAVVRISGGLVTPEAAKIFDAALALDAKEPRARFFRGLALEQHNEPKEALVLWVKIIRDGPSDAEWMPGLRQRASELAAKLKLDPLKEVPGVPLATLPSSAGLAAPTAAPVADAKRSPTSEDVAAAAQLSPVEQNAMVQGMVEGLEQRLHRNPNDLDGWLMLARSRKVLGDSNAARTAIGRAEELFGKNETARARIAQVATELGVN